jgi:hypothetical protein
MRHTLRRHQLALTWSDGMRWDELPVAVRAELQALLRALLRHADQPEPAVEAGAGDE